MPAAPACPCRFQRILLKLSGESLCQEGGRGFSPAIAAPLVKEIADVLRRGVRIALVVGAGNLIRGSDLQGTRIDQVSADNMGMLATVINGIALRELLLAEGVPAQVLNILGAFATVDAYCPRKAVRLMEQGQIVILTGGTGNPFFTTDTAAVLRALEIGADACLKATKVDGVYDDDPVTNARARRYATLSYREVLHRQLGVMDFTAITLASGRRLPIIVFSLHHRGALQAIVQGDKNRGTMIGEQMP